MPVLVLQLVVLVLLAVAVAWWAASFPFPSPLIKLVLPPKLRWPEMQIRSWLRSGRINVGYQRFFDRDPERSVPVQPGLVAPADGLVTSAEVHDGVRYVVIALNFWDMHVQRSPAAGVVRSVAQTGDILTDGEGREFAFLRAKRCPVQSRIELQTARDGMVAIRLITSLAARRIEVWVRPGEQVERGQRIGRIRLGSTVVLEVDENIPLQVQVGQRVTAGETLISIGERAT